MRVYDLNTLNSSKLNKPKHFLPGDFIPNSLIPGTKITKTSQLHVTNGELIIPESPYKVTCDQSIDISCNTSNHLDISSKCSSLCQSHKQAPLFNGNSNSNDNILTCQCIPIIEHFSLDFSNIDSPFLALENPIPSDIEFNNRNFLQLHEQNRFKSLVFG